MKEYVPLLQTALWVALALIGLACSADRWSIG